MSENDDDKPAIEANLKKAKAKLAMYKRLLTREHASGRVMGHFYEAIVLSILLYINPKKMQKLRTFHRDCARYITKQIIRPANDGTDECIYPSSESVLEDAGLFEIEAYPKTARYSI